MILYDVGKHKRTLEAIFRDPVASNILWSDIEAMLISLKAEISEGRGSRIRIVLGGVRGVSQTSSGERN